MKLLAALYSCKAVIPSVFADNFNRPDDTTLGPAYEQLIGTLAVVGNQCRGPVGQTDGVARYIGAFQPDQFAECSFISAVAANEQYAGLGVRLSSGATFNGYTFITRNDGAGGSGIYRWTGGVPTVIAALGGTTTWAANDAMRLEAQGTTISAKKNGTVILSVTDATYAAGNPGINQYDIAVVDNAVFGSL